MEKSDFIYKDFELKLEYLNGQYSRLWQRLGFFLSLETALFGFFGWLAYDKDLPQALWLPCILGITISLIWYIVAAQDRSLVKHYRIRIEDSAEDIELKLGKSKYKNNHPAKKQENNFECINSWYWRPISITKLPVWISIVLLISWSLLLYCILSGKSDFLAIKNICVG